MATRRQLADAWARSVAYSLENDNEISIQRAKGVKVIGSPRLLTFVISLKSPKDLSATLKLEEEMALRMGASSCRISRQFGEVVIEAPLPNSLWKTLEASSLTLGKGLWMSLGQTSRGTPVKCRLDTPCIAPVLVAGRTGSGKTETLRLMIWQLALQNDPEDLKFILFDPKRSRFEAFSRLPHLVMPILHNTQQSFGALRWLMVELDRRLVSGEIRPDIIFVVDELIEMFRANETIAGGSLGRLAQLGRERGIHLILATQRPDRKYMDRLAAANLGLRLVGRVSDAVEATVACGCGNSGAHKLCGAGDFLGIVSGSIQRIAVALVSDKDLGQLPAMEVPPKMPYIKDVDLAGMIDEQHKNGSVFTPAEYAASLSGVGISRLKQLLKIGQPRATRLRQSWAIPVLEELKRTGYVIKKI